MNKKISTLLLCSLVSCVSITLPNVQDELKRDTTQHPNKLAQELEKPKRTDLETVICEFVVLGATVLGAFVGRTIMLRINKNLQRNWSLSKNDKATMELFGVILGGIVGAFSSYDILKEYPNTIHDKIRDVNEEMESENIDSETVC